jgi:hypothetical protein
MTTFNSAANVLSGKRTDSDGRITCGVSNIGFELYGVKSGSPSYIKYITEIGFELKHFFSDIVTNTFANHFSWHPLIHYLFLRPKYCHRFVTGLTFYCSCIGFYCQLSPS